MVDRVEHGRLTAFREWPTRRTNEIPTPVFHPPANPLRFRFPSVHPTWLCPKWIACLLGMQMVSESNQLT